MILWRLSRHAAIDGAGGLIVSGRWHTKGHRVVYSSHNPATCLLEALVHLEIDSEDRPDHFQIFQVNVPDRIATERISAASLPGEWRQNIGTTQSIGDAWLESNRSLLLEVPSALVPETWKVLINTNHRQARTLKVVKVYRHPFDQRLF